MQEIVCPDCGRNIKGQAELCLFCGKRLEGRGGGRAGSKGGRGFTLWVLVAGIILVLSCYALTTRSGALSGIATRLQDLEIASIFAEATHTPTPTPTPVPTTKPPLTQAWPVGAIAALVLAVGLLTGLVLNVQRNRRRKRFVLEVYNGGNIRDRYELWTETFDAIRVRFALDGVPLTQREIVERVEAAETVSVPSAGRAAPARQGGRF